MKSEAEEEIIRKLKHIEKLLHQQDNRPLNLVEAAEYLSISQSHLYKLTRKKLIPCHKPTGKYLYFFRREMESWVKNSAGSIVNCQSAIAGAENNGKPFDKLRAGMDAGLAVLLDLDGDSEPPP